MTDTTRRTFVHAVAWGVPVVAVAATAPAFAASGKCSMILGRWHSKNPAYYKIKATCTAPIKSVTIDGKAAAPYTAPYQNWWYITTSRYTGNRDLRVVITLTDGTVVTQTVAFTPWNNGN